MEVVESHCPNSTFNQSAMLLRIPSPIMLGKGIVYWNLQWDVPVGMVSYFTPLGEGELLNFHWDPFVLLQAGPAETHYTHAVEKGENMEVLVWPTSPLVHLLMPDSTASPTPTNNRYNIHNQVKLLKLPTSLSARPDWHILFSSGTIIWLPSFFPLLAWRTL